MAKKEYIKIKDGVRDYKVRSNVTVPYSTSARLYPLLRQCLACKELVFAIRGMDYGAVNYECPTCGYSTCMQTSQVVTVLSSSATEESAHTLKYF